jgi:anthranilate phosphoribosyltransferase
MDVLERLGVNVELTPEQAQQLVGHSPIVFLNARKHHPALGPIAPVRKALGFRTVFNLLGPICNPAAARRQLLGVSNARYGAVLARSLRTLGSERALVVAGADGLDELSLHGPSRTWLLDETGAIAEQTLEPKHANLSCARLDEVLGGDVAHNAEVFVGILQGRVDGAPLHHTALNAGAALWVAGRVDGLAQGVARASEILASGAAHDALVRYRDLSRSIGTAA